MDDADDAALSGHGDNVKYSLAVWTLWDGYFLSRAIGRNSVTLRSLRSYTHLPLKSHLWGQPGDSLVSSSASFSLSTFLIYMFVFSF